MFDTLIQTGNVQEALERYVDSKHRQASESTDIELF
jgi:hypothetical protein